jgi:hypothetical protein
MHFTFPTALRHSAIGIILRADPQHAFMKRTRLKKVAPTPRADDLAFFRRIRIKQSTCLWQTNSLILPRWTAASTLGLETRRKRLLDANTIVYSKSFTARPSLPRLVPRSSNAAEGLFSVHTALNRSRTQIPLRFGTLAVIARLRQLSALFIEAHR